MLISVVIPTYNRPELLLEAARSIARQTYQDFEVVVVDDGSAPPVSRDALQEVLGQRVLLLTHANSQGVPKAKNAGVRAAHGEVILLLDDDDLLVPDALQIISRAYWMHPEIDCLFMAVQPFGPYAEGPRRNRESATRAIVEESKPDQRDGLYFFGRNLFDALLKRVPIDFQRPAARRGAWNMVGEFDETTLFSESSWAIRASTRCVITLTTQPVMEWRIHGANFGWPEGLTPDEAQRRQIENGIMAGESLMRTFIEQERASCAQARKIREFQSSQYFSKAYHLRNRNKLDGLWALVSAARLAPRLAHVKLLATYLIPGFLLRKRR